MLMSSYQGQVQRCSPSLGTVRLQSFLECMSSPVTIEGWGLPGGSRICWAQLGSSCAQDEGDKVGEEEVRLAQPPSQTAQWWPRMRPVPEQQAAATVRALRAGTSRLEWGSEGPRQGDWPHAPAGAGGLAAA